MNSFDISMSNPSFTSTMSIPILPTLSGPLVIEGQIQAFKYNIYPTLDFVPDNEDISLVFYFSDSQFKMFDKGGHWLQWAIDPTYTWDSIYNWRLNFDGEFTLNFYLNDIEQEFITMSSDPLIFTGFSENVNILTGDGIISFKEL